MKATLVHLIFVKPIFVVRWAQHSCHNSGVSTCICVRPCIRTWTFCAWNLYSLGVNVYYHWAERRVKHPGSRHQMSRSFLEIKCQFWQKCFCLEHNLIIVDGIRNPLAYRFSISRCNVPNKTQDYTSKVKITLVGQISLETKFGMKMISNEMYNTFWLEKFNQLYPACFVLFNKTNLLSISIQYTHMNVLRQHT